MLCLICVHACVALQDDSADSDEEEEGGGGGSDGHIPYSAGSGAVVPLGWPKVCTSASD